MDSILLNSGAVMLVDSSLQTKQNKKYENSFNLRSNNIRIIQHLTGALLFLIIINIGLVSWIIQSTQLLHDPLGGGSIPNTIRIEGSLVSNKTLQTDQIIAPNSNTREPRLGPFLTITSNQSTTLQSNSWNNKDTNSILLSSNGIEFHVQNSLEISSHHNRGHQTFKINNSKVSVEDSNLYSINTESGGLRVGELLEINQIFGSHSHNMRVESRTESVIIESEKNILIESLVGSVHVRVPKEIIINSKKILLNSADVRLTNIHQERSSNYASASINIDKPIAYQLCLCATNNQVFLAMPDTDCRANDQMCVL